MTDKINLEMLFDYLMEIGDFNSKDELFAFIVTFHDEILVIFNEIE